MPKNTSSTRGREETASAKTSSRTSRSEYAPVAGSDPRAQLNVPATSSTSSRNQRAAASSSRTAGQGSVASSSTSRNQGATSGSNVRASLNAPTFGTTSRNKAATASSSRNSGQAPPTASSTSRENGAVGSSSRAAGNPIPTSSSTSRNKGATASSSRTAGQNAPTSSSSRGRHDRDPTAGSQSSTRRGGAPTAGSATHSGTRRGGGGGLPTVYEQDWAYNNAPSRALMPPPSAGSSSTVRGPGSVRGPDSTRGPGTASSIDTAWRDGNELTTAGRYNNSRGTVTLRSALIHPFAEGTFRYVAEGTYTEGSRKGMPAIMKWFKSGHVFDAAYYSMDILANEKALEIIDKFNGERIIDRIIRINMPQVFCITNGDLIDRKMLVEPKIHAYQKFNSNSGWVTPDRDVWVSVMQALSHYSYHESDGQFLLCDLQGGIYRTSIILTDPVILTPSQTFGVTDCGQAGIDGFFASHVCSHFCKPGWKRVANPRPTLRVTSGTTMQPINIPTRQSRPQETVLM